LIKQHAAYSPGKRLKMEFITTKAVPQFRIPFKKVYFEK